MEVLHFFLRWIHFLAGITWIGILYYFNFVQTPFFAETEAACENRSNSKIGTARTLVVSLGCDGDFPRGTFDVFDSVAPDGRRSLFQFAIWHHDYSGWLAGNHHVFKCLACDLAKAADRHRIGQSSSAGRTALTCRRGCGTTRRAHVEDQYGVLHPHAVFHGGRDALSRIGWTHGRPRHLLVDHSYYYRCGRV